MRRQCTIIEEEMFLLIRDRGSKKWVSMMLPEHVKLLKEYNESLTKVEKPVLDEQKLEEFNETICEAMEFHHSLHFTYYKHGVIKHIEGHVHVVRSIEKELRIIGTDRNNYTLFLDDILEIESR